MLTKSQWSVLTKMRQGWNLCIDIESGVAILKKEEKDSVTWYPVSDMIINHEYLGASIEKYKRIGCYDYYKLTDKPWE